MAAHHGGQNPEAWLAARRTAGIPDETWADIPGWPHQVSDQGRIRTVKGKILAQGATGTRPYPLTTLCANGERWKTTVHSLVLTAFEGLRPEGQESRHLNDVPTHNWYPENLAWGNWYDNARDKLNQDAYHTPEAKARRSDAARRGRATQLANLAALDDANAPSQATGPRWLQTVKRYVPWLRHKESPRTYHRRSEAPITDSSQPTARVETRQERSLPSARVSTTAPLTEGNRLAEIGHDAE